MNQPAKKIPLIIQEPEENSKQETGKVLLYPHSSTITAYIRVVGDLLVSTAGISTNKKTLLFSLGLLG